MSQDQLTPEERLHNEAAGWFVRINAREPTTEEISDWQRWLTADEAHRKAFSQYEDLWQTIGQTELHFRMQSRNGSDTSRLEDNRSVRRRWPIAVAAAALVAAVGAALVWAVSTRSSQLPSSAAVETSTAEDRTYTLADGSSVHVGARTRLVVDFGESTRNVIVDEGEVYFDVAHDTRPFVVGAGPGTVTAVGTAFNVHYVKGRVAVAVVEGTVNVRNLADAGAPVSVLPGARDLEARSQPVTVQAGQGVVYGRGASSVEEIDTRVATAWRDGGQLKFIREPLGYVAADIERYADIRISIADPAVADLLYTGTVIPDDVDDWLTVLGHAFPITVQRINKRTVLLKLREQQADGPEAI